MRHVSFQRVALLLAISGGAILPSHVLADDLAATFHHGLDIAAATATDQHNETFTITGLSGIAWLGAVDGIPDDRFLAVMDNSNRLIELSIFFDNNGGISSVTVLRGISLAETFDFEGIALGDAMGSTVWLSEETTPALRRFDLTTGAAAGVYTPPPVFTSRRPNRGLESLTRVAGVGTLYTANEEALSLDGPASTPLAGTTVRLLRLGDALSSTQVAYTTDPIHGLIVSGARSGVADLVLLPSGRLLALERSFGLAIPPFLTRLYEVLPAGATDISTMGGLIGQTFTPASKRLLYSGDQTNLEGLCLGPQLASGAFVLVGIVDDGDAISVNHVVSFTLTGPVTTPPCRPDWNGDGALDSSDFFAFLADFFLSSADFNDDDETNSLDFFDYLADFFAGCD